MLIQWPQVSCVLSISVTALCWRSCLSSTCLSQRSCQRLFYGCLQQGTTPIIHHSGHKPWLKGYPGRLTLNHWEAESNRLLGDYSPTVSRPPLWTPRGFQLSMKEFRSNTLSSVKAEFIRTKRSLRGMKAGNEYGRCRGGNHFRG